MRVDWAILCRYAEAEGGVATIIGAGIDTYFLPQLPAAVGVLVAVRLVGPEDELEQPHDIAFRVLGPNLSEISKLEGQFEISSNPLKEPGWEGGAIFVTLQQFEATEYGSHSLEIAIDHREMKSVPFLVRTPPGPPAS